MDLKVQQFPAGNLRKKRVVPPVVNWHYGNLKRWKFCQTGSNHQKYVRLCTPMYLNWKMLWCYLQTCNLWNQRFFSILGQWMGQAEFQCSGLRSSGSCTPAHGVSLHRRNSHPSLPCQRVTNKISHSLDQVTDGQDLSFLILTDVLTFPPLSFEFYPWIMANV